MHSISYASSYDYREVALRTATVVLPRRPNTEAISFSAKGVVEAAAAGNKLDATATVPAKPR